MKTQFIAALALAVAVLVGTVGAEDKKAVTSGPQVGKELPGPFHPLNVTGDKAGKKACLYCSNGDNPVAMIFARDCTPSIEKLIKAIDANTVKNAGCEMGSFVVFCSDDEGLQAKLKKFDKEAGLKKIVLSIDNPAGPEKYEVNKDAEVTVVLYKSRKVAVNQAFKKGELTEKDIENIVKELPKITK